MSKSSNPFTGGYRETADDLCRDDSDGCAGARRALLGSGYLTILSQAVTTGAFFTALLVAMGADDAYIGYVTMATTLCMALQFPAPLFWERRQRRKALMLWLGALGDALTYLGLPVIPLLPIPTEWKLVGFMALTLVSGCISQFCLPARNAWMMQSIPLAKRLSYTSLTSMMHTVINLVSVFLAGLMMDAVEGNMSAIGVLSPTMMAILLLRLIACTATVASTVWMALRVPEFPYNADEHRPVSASLLFEPFFSRPFVITTVIPCLWALIGGMIGSYFSLHLIDNVKMSYTLITSASFISTPMIFLITPVWTRILRQRDWYKTIAWAILGYSLAYFSNVFISDVTPFFYFIAIIVGHVFSPGITIVSNNLIYLHMPEENRTAYFAVYSLLTTLFRLVGQALGTAFVTATESVSFSLFGIPICNLQLVSGVAAVLSIILAVTVLLVRSRSHADK